MKKLSRVLPWLPVLAMVMPLMASGQTAITMMTVVVTGVNILIPLLMFIGVLVFIWGIVNYIPGGGNMEKRKTARGYIIYGLIGLFIMIGFWGITKVVFLTFNIQEGGAINMPSIDLHP